jgi:hypothetical protein
MTMIVNLVTVGTINSGATPIVADVTTLGPAVAVTLVTDYAMGGPQSFPSRPSFTGTDAANMQYPRTLPSGTTFRVLQCEATALIAAGAAVLA